MVTQPGSRSAATTLPRSSGSATPTESSPAGGCPQLTAQQCTQTPQSGVERPDPPICVHSCDPKATHSPSPQHNSVHKRPNSAQRAPILSSVYTIAATRGRPRHNSVHKRPKPARRGPILPSVYTIAATRGRPRHDSVHKRPKLAQRAPILSSVYTLVVLKGAHCSTVYTNAPIRRGEALATQLCTLLRSQGPSRLPTVKPTERLDDGRGAGRLTRPLAPQ